MSSTNPAPASKQPQHIGVDCRVCGTRMYGRPEHIGRKLKCPDCGAATVLPEPKVVAKNIPAALEGEQYELWDVDEQPSAAAQPTYIAVKCRRCDTLMYATEKQVGETIVCPDCGQKHIVPPPAKPVAKRSVLARDAETPKLDPNADPGARPAFVPATTRGMTFEEEADAAYARAKDESVRTGKAIRLDTRGRPVMPRWPLLTGILSFPFYSGCPGRWLALTIGLVLSLGLLLGGVFAWMSWKGQGDASGALVAMAGLAQTLIGAISFIIWLAAASNIFIAIVSQSAVGNDRIAEWPSLNFISSMGEMLPVSVAVIFTGAPGWMLAQLVAQEPWHMPLFVGVTILLGFPPVHLSQLAGGATWELIELRVLSAMVRCPLSMLVVYIESALLAAICVAAGIAVAPFHDMMPLALAPLYVFCLMLYARILGRLAWRLSEKMPEERAIPLE
jgi:DNA-directed RNA polymerase subunit M/transcription elongation factor TFIIS